MTTNQHRAAEVIYELIGDELPGTEIKQREHAADIAHDLDVDGLLAPGLPGPTGTWAEGMEWRWGSHGEVVWTALYGTVMVQNIEPGNFTPEQAREFAYRLLAAADYAEGKAQ